MLVDGVDVSGEPVEDASEGSGLEQPGGTRRKAGEGFVAKAPGGATSTAFYWA